MGVHKHWAAGLDLRRVTYSCAIILNLLGMGFNGRAVPTPGTKALKLVNVQLYCDTL